MGSSLSQGLGSGECSAQLHIETGIEGVVGEFALSEGSRGAGSFWVRLEGVRDAGLRNRGSWLWETV